MHLLAALCCSMRGNSGFSILLKDTSACRWGRLGIELTTSGWRTTTLPLSHSRPKLCSGVALRRRVPYTEPCATPWRAPPLRLNNVSRRRRPQELWLVRLVASHFQQNLLLHVTRFNGRTDHLLWCLSVLPCCYLRKGNCSSTSISSNSNIIRLAFVLK